MVAVQGEIPGVGWQPDAAQVPTIDGNTRANNTVPFIFRMTEKTASLFPTGAQIAGIVADNTDATSTYAYVLDALGDARLVVRDPGVNQYHQYGVANALSTLNLALDTTADAVYGGQRATMVAGDTVVIQSVGATPENVLVDNLTIRASATSTDLNLTLGTVLVNGTPIAGGGVTTVTLADYALNSGANVDVTGNALGNTIVGNSGNNTISGLDGNDVITGGRGADAILGGQGDDTINYTAGDGVDTVDGGEGGPEVDGDLLNVTATGGDDHIFVNPDGIDPTRLDVDLDLVGSATAGADVELDVTNVEEIFIDTGAGNDTVVVSGDLGGTGVSQSTVTLNGGAGNDTLDASGVNGTSPVRVLFNGGEGNDILKGGVGTADQANYADGPAGYNITVAPSGTVTVEDISFDGTPGNGDDEGTDTLTGVEVINLNGTILDLTDAVRLFDSDDHLIGTFDTLQAAVNAVTEADSTIRILAGSELQGQVVIDGTLPADAARFEGLSIVGMSASAPTLDGSNSGVVIKAPADVVGTALDPWNSSSGTRAINAIVTVIGVVGVSISNLTVDGDGKAGTGNAQVGLTATAVFDYVGIAYVNSSGALDHVTVQEVRDGPLNGVQRGQAIYATNAAANADKLFAVTDSLVTDFQKTGILARNMDVTLSGNTVTGAGATTLIAQNGIQVSQDSTGDITGNVISGMGYTGTANASSSGMYLWNSAALTVTGNSITGVGESATNGPGTGSSTGIFVDGVDGSTITGNDFHDAAYGVWEFNDINPENNVDTNTYDDVAINHLLGPTETLTNSFTPAGTDGVDIYAGAAGDDILTGQDGDDTLTGNDGEDTLAGGLGIDTADYASESGVGAIVVNLTSAGPTDIDGDTLSDTGETAQTARDTFGDEDTLSGIDKVEAGNGYGDTVVLDGALADWNITFNSGSGEWSATGIAGSATGQSYTLDGVEKLAFQSSPTQSVHLVDPTGAASAYTSVQNAVNTAVSGDILLLSSGTFLGGIDIGGGAGGPTGKDITILGANHGLGDPSLWTEAATIIDRIAAMNGDLTVDGVKVAAKTISAGFINGSWDAIAFAETDGLANDALTVRNSIITIDATGAPTRGFGFNIGYNTDDVTIDNVDIGTFTGFTFAGTSYGVYLNGNNGTPNPNRDITITDSTFDVAPNRSVSIAFDNQIGGSQIDISGNTFGNIGANGVAAIRVFDFFGPAAGLSGPVDYSGITNNTFVNAPGASGSGAAVYGLLSNETNAVNPGEVVTIGQATYNNGSGPTYAQVINAAATPAGQVLFGDSAADIIVGSNAAASGDTIDGAGGNDHIEGLAGNDRISGCAADDTINGGAGTDVGLYDEALLDGATFNYTIVATATGLQVTEAVVQNLDEGTDTLTGVEVLEFAGEQVLFVDDNMAGAPYASIGAALAAANALTGPVTILVAAGTYNEDVLITRDNVKLISVAGAGSTVINGQAASTGAIAVQADGVTIGQASHGFTVNAAVNQTAAIWLQTGVDDLIVGGNTVNATTSTALSNEYGAVTDVLLEGNTFNANTSTGPVVYFNHPDSENVQVINNTFNSSGSVLPLGVEFERRRGIWQRLHRLEHLCGDRTVGCQQQRHGFGKRVERLLGLHRPDHSDGAGRCRPRGHHRRHRRHGDRALHPRRPGREPERQWRGERPHRQ